jgi:hypothetical protein
MTLVKTEAVEFFRGFCFFMCFSSRVSDFPVEFRTVAIVGGFPAALEMTRRLYTVFSPVEDNAIAVIECSKLF